MTIQLKIQLNNISNPAVWRRVLVPADFTFEDLHSVIQISFGWEFAHLYQFSPKGYGSEPTIAPNSDIDWDEPDLNAEKTKLKKIFTTEKQTYTYIYDFGDDWIHKITVEKILKEKIKSPKCIKGQGKCPPEDCGGPWGYLDMLETLSNPKNEEYEERREWLGLSDDEPWDVNEFEMEDVNVMLEEGFE
ncbi:MAG: plasmid pRiA4b ORF-3 family protein [Bacteroidales bacterium]|nr:plasmid pRiA4b ORF-3 family protein [Bacteroidales bacterium]